MISGWPPAAGDRWCAPQRLHVVLPWKFAPRRRRSARSRRRPHGSRMRTTVRVRSTQSCPARRCRRRTRAHGDGHGDSDRADANSAPPGRPSAPGGPSRTRPSSLPVGVRGEADRGVPGQCGLHVGEAEVQQQWLCTAGRRTGNSTDTAENATRCPRTRSTAARRPVHADRAYTAARPAVPVLGTPVM